MNHRRVINAEVDQSKNINNKLHDCPDEVEKWKYNNGKTFVKAGDTLQVICMSFVCPIGSSNLKYTLSARRIVAEQVLIPLHSPPLSQRLIFCLIFRFIEETAY